MDYAPHVVDRLVQGVSLLYVHTDAPKWKLVRKRNGFGFERLWCYPNTTPRGEAFATISECLEWLIVMQRGVEKSLVPRALHLATQSFHALGREEICHLEGVFGCPVKKATVSAIYFWRDDLFLRPESADEQKFGKMARVFSEKGEPGTQIVFEPTLARKTLSLVNEGKSLFRIAEKLQLSEFALQNLVQKISAMAPWELSAERDDIAKFLNEIDQRHRRALSRSAKNAAEFVADLVQKQEVLRGIDIGGGELDVTEVFLRELRSLSSCRIQLEVVDPVLSHKDDSMEARACRIQGELGVDVQFKPLWWSEFSATTEPQQQFDFAVGFQLLSLMDDHSISHLFKTLIGYLKRGGRFFAAVEPFDRATMSKYQVRNYTFFQRPVHWYHEMARRAGLEPVSSSFLLAHCDDETSMMANIRLEKV
jgi:hypothetical protein